MVTPGAPSDSVRPSSSARTARRRPWLLLSGAMLLVASVLGPHDDAADAIWQAKRDLMQH